MEPDWIDKEHAWQQAEFTAKDGTEFLFAHNLPNIPGMSIGDCIVNWEARTEERTQESLIEYIRSKNHMTGCWAYTMKEFDEKIKSIDDKTD